MRFLGLAAVLCCCAGLPLGEEETEGRFLAEDKPKHKFCNTTMYGLKGDYAYESCGGFCKEAKKQNHCRFCKCRTCSFCTGVTTLLKLREKKQGGGKLKKLTLPSTPTDIEKQIDSIEATIKKRKRRANRKEVKAAKDQKKVKDLKAHVKKLKSARASQ